MNDAERRRLVELRDEGVPWHRWGPYLAERSWGTVREDYSADGTAWEYLPHDHARSRVYRWCEDGLLGISDETGHLCFALALWNETDPILKERLFGLTGNEGNHGEDVKEYYYYLDSAPSHAYLKALYRYPQRAFPYTQLVEENRRRGRGDPEFELLDTGVFDGDRYFDVVVEYAKAAPEDILIRITATNRGPDPAPLHLLPTLWCRNDWVWGWDKFDEELFLDDPSPLGDWTAAGPYRRVGVKHGVLGDYWLLAAGLPDLLFTNNETNFRRLFGVENSSPYVKDGINDAVVDGAPGTVNPGGTGTKVAAHYRLTVPAGGSESVLLRLTNQPTADPFAGAAALFAQRLAETDAFYARFDTAACTPDERLVLRQAFAGLLWSKQFYHLAVDRWLDGDPDQPPPPAQRRRGRNHRWRHLNGHDVIAMPDKWEYPWFAAWDLAFHCIPLALVSPTFAKQQLILLGRDWYQHPNGELPAYEWAFGDVNPPVHAWAALRVYKIEGRVGGHHDVEFLERVFHKLLLNFTWWVNRKDPDGLNVFEGGFLGLDNIGVFDRSAPLPTGGHLAQADGTAWMGMFCLNMLQIALELARSDRAYEDVAVKFFEHFLYIADALNQIGGTTDMIGGSGSALWDEEDEFFYDVLRLPDGRSQRLKVRSLVGLIPLLAVETIEPDLIEQLPEFRERMEWFLANRPHLANLVSRWQVPGAGERRLLALVRGHRMKRLLSRMLDPNEFLSDYGVRSLSKYHRDNPYVLHVDGVDYTVRYDPGESTSGVFGGNSNWRGPVWFPINYLIIEALQKFHHYYGDDFLVECPTGSGQKLTLWQIGDLLSRRLIALFTRGPDGRRPVFGTNERCQRDPHWRDYPLYYEYFHGDTGAGLGASHQTGWTALVAKLIEQTSRRPEVEGTRTPTLVHHPPV